MDYLYQNLNKPTRLYIKQCTHCDLKYFGKYTGKNIEKYEGSGVVWQRHLKKYKIKPIHLWNSKWYYDTSIVKFAFRFSRLNKISESNIWANLIEENGLDGGKTWDKSKGKNHPFLNDLQKKRVANGTHHLIGKVVCVDKNGKIISIDSNLYHNQLDEEYVIHTSKEGFRRRNKSEKDRKIPPNKSGFDFGDKKNSLKGEARTENQKKSSNDHSKRMKGTVVNKKGEQLSESHKKALKVPRPGAGKHKNHVKGSDHFASKKIQCPNCGKIGGGGSMKRWHFDNCKDKDKL